MTEDERHVELIAAIAKVQKVLDEKPVPINDRLMWDPVTATIMKLDDYAKLYAK